MLTRYSLNFVKQFRVKPTLYKSRSHMTKPEGRYDDILLDTVRNAEKPEPKEMFPLLCKLGISTDERVHKFAVPVEGVLQVIKLGAVKVTIVAQYCHYLAHLSEICDAEDSQYYASKTLEIFLQIHNSKEIPDFYLIKLYSRVAATSVENCRIVCDTFLRNDDLRTRTVRDSTRARDLIAACYRFGLWDHANQLVAIFDDSSWLHFRQTNAIAEGIMETSKKFNSPSLNSPEQTTTRHTLGESLFKFLESCYRRRIMFLTEHRDRLMEALLDLGVEVKANPVINESGVCSNCGSSLPMLGDDPTRDLNKSIRSSLHRRYKNTYVNSDLKDLINFDKFLNDIRGADGKDIDYVMDGLNVIYKTNSNYTLVKTQVTDDFERTRKRHNPDSMTEYMIRVFQRTNLLKGNKKILVIGRRHMQNLPGLMKFFAANGIHYYGSMDRVNDDLYSLYAATLSSKTLLISNDYFRDHLASLPEAENKDTLARWIDTHQVWIDAKTMMAIPATRYEKLPSVDRQRNCFHLPIVDYKKYVNISSNAPPPHLGYGMITWACCKVGQAFTD